MPDPQKKPSTTQQAAQGFASLQALTKKAAAENKKKSEKPDGPPAIDTGSVSGFLSSAGKRLKYAVYGPDKKD